jgi:hypothetical protein
MQADADESTRRLGCYWEVLSGGIECTSIQEELVEAFSEMDDFPASK